MKMPEEHLDVNMFAPCGMNCKVCYKHCYHKTPCAGCFNSDKGKPEHCRKCKIKDCIKEKGHSFCYECSVFPCKLITNLEKSYNTRYGVSLMANSFYVKEHGLERFMDEQKKRFTCPLCGGIISIHDKECSECQTRTGHGQQQGEPVLCEECYAGHSRVTPLLNPLECLQKHTQYICGTCGRCICIERDGTRGLQRWNFPFKSLDIAKLYLRTADDTNKKSCGIYEIKSSNGRISYKIFPDEADLQQFLKKNRDKTCEKMAPVFTAGVYTEYQDTQVRRLTSEEIERYLSER